jgi:ABC-type glutathione transport system ATPase component
MIMPLLEARGLSKTFPGRRSPALDGIDLAFELGEAVGIVGESGSGKTTLGRSLLGLERPTEGAVAYAGAPIPTSGPAFRRSRRELQLIPQHASGALNPRVSVRAHFDEVIRAHRLGQGREAQEMIARRLAEVRLEPRHADSFVEAARLTTALSAAGDDAAMPTTGPER